MFGNKATIEKLESLLQVKEGIISELTNELHQYRIKYGYLQPKIKKKEINYSNVVWHDQITVKNNVDLDNVENKENPFYEKKIVITGLFENFSRDKLSELVNSYGAQRASSISKKTDIVFVGQDPGPAKIDKINELNLTGCSIKIIYEVELISILESL